MTKENKFKFTLDDNGFFKPYRPSHRSWAFVEKEFDTFKQLHFGLGCKDYTHEIIANTLYGKSVALTSKLSNGEKIRLDRLQIVMFFESEDFSKVYKPWLYKAKNFVQEIESKYLDKTTLVSELNCPSNDISCILLTFPKEYTFYPPLYHYYIALFRTLVETNKHSIKDKDFKKYAKNILVGKDKNILNYVHNNDILDLILKNINLLIKGLSIKQVYPEYKNQLSGLNDYHGSFGMVAACSRTLGPVELAKRTNKLLQDNKKPIYDE